LEKNLSINSLLDTTKTIAAEIFNEKIYPWEILPYISSFIKKLGTVLPKKKYILYKKDVWIANNAKICSNATIVGPAIIDADSEIRNCAHIRKNVIIGKNCVIGNSTEIKNSILFDEVQAPHFNYIGDSILGFKAHLGAGAILSNVKSDKSAIAIKSKENISTELRKFGSIIADFVEIGCNSVINPGVIVSRYSNVYPLSSVRGVVPKERIFKGQNNIVKKYKKISNKFKIDGQVF
jgi:NDP-sugar pyrophosphorylase family protein